MDRFPRVCLTSTFAIALYTGPLWAQETPPPAAEPAPAPAPAAEPAPAPAPVAEAPVTTAEPPARAAEEAAPAPAPAEENPPAPPSWFRIDSDGYGLQLWAGATHDLGAFQLATDIYVFNTIGEFDIGPAFTFADGAVALTPMVGVQFDWFQKRMVSLVAPQLFTIVNLDSIYFESWIQGFFYGPFTDGAEVLDTLYTRDFLLYKVSDMFAIGPNVELNYGFDAGEITSLPVGGAAMVGYGTGNTLLLALGYETNEDARAAAGGSGDRAIFGRFTFIHYF